MKVLYVDDEADIRTIAKLALTHANYDVTLCDSGKQALHLAPDLKPDLILLDVMMPDFDGPTTLAWIQNDKSINHIPVIFISAKVQKKEVANYLKLGAIGVINKPFNPITLGKDIETIWSNWLSEKENAN